MKHTSWFLLNGPLARCANQRTRSQYVVNYGLQELGSGCHKNVFELDSDWVLKVGSLDAIQRDALVWEKIHLPRRRYYAETYFERFLEIQKRGRPVTLFDDPTKTKITKIDLDHLRLMARRDGIWDIRVANVLDFNGTLRIIDARPR